METIQLDAFRRMDYEHFVPKDVITQRSNTLNTVLIIGGVIVLALVVFAIIEENSKNKLHEEGNQK